MSFHKEKKDDIEVVHIDHTLYATPTAMKEDCKDYTISYGKEVIEPIKKLEYELQLQGHTFLFKPLAQRYNAYTYPSIRIAFIDPRRQSVEELMYTIVHEGLHLQQAQTNTLVWDRTTKALLWQGTPFSTDNLPDHKDMNGYLNLPWEKDAREREVDLYRRVMNTNEIPPETPKIKRKRNA